MAINNYITERIFSGKGYEIRSYQHKKQRDNFRVMLEFGDDHLIVSFKVDITEFFLFLSKTFTTNNS